MLFSLKEKEKTYRRQDSGSLFCECGIPEQLKREGTVDKTAGQENGSQRPSNGGQS